MAQRARIVGWWTLWLVSGAALVLGAVSLPFLLPLPLVAVVLAARGRCARRAIVAAPLGGAAALLFIAFVNRGPDGMTCDVTPTSSTCSETLNGLPWLALAVVAIAIAAALELRGRHRWNS